MQRKEIYSLVILGILFFSSLPPFRASNGIFPSTLASSQIPHIPNPVPEPSSQGPLASTAAPGDDARSVPPPAPLLTLNTTGAFRSVELGWNLTQTFNNHNLSSDVQILADDGYLYREELNFTRIEAQNITAIIEDDYTPYYWDLGLNEPVFMGFQINGTCRARLDGFWMGLEDGSGGTFQYAVYAAEPGVYPYARPNVSAPVVATAQTTVATLSGPAWVWFDVDASSTILDPTSTYNNTFFTAIWRVTPFQHLYVIAMDDTDLFGYPTDYDDEGDAYMDWSLTYMQEDYLLMVELVPEEVSPYPTDVNLVVNAFPIEDGTLPGQGWWENDPTPPIDLSGGGIRYYDVDACWSRLIYNVSWQGWFMKAIDANTTFQVWADRLYTTWNITLNVNYPLSALDRIINVSVEGSWTVHNVTHNGMNHTAWSLLSIGGRNYVYIRSVSDGDWSIFCTALNHIEDVEIRDLDANVITEANATDTVSALGYIREGDGTGITTGEAFLFIYDPAYTKNYTDSISAPTAPGVGEFEWVIWSSVQEALVAAPYTIKVAWTNGTAAGMNSTTLIVHPMTRFEVLVETPKPGEELTRTDTLQFQVSYRTHDWAPLDAATVSVINDTAHAPWETWKNTNRGDGKYFIEVFVNESQVDVRHNITLVFVQLPYVGQNYSRSFVVISVPLLPGFLEGCGCTYDAIDTRWLALPNPYINDTSRQFTIRVTDETGEPMPSVVLTPILYWGGYTKILDSIDVFVETGIPGTLGYYNITIDTTPIQGIAFHVGDEPYIRVQVNKYGYDMAWSEPLYFQPMARHCHLDILPEYQDIQLYANWTYAVPLRVILRDNFTLEDFSHGTVIAEFPVLGNITMELATPGIGLYEISLLDTSTIPCGTYRIPIRSNASDYISSENYVTLTILPKNTIGHRIVISSQPPPNYGTVVQLEAWFFFEGESSSTRQGSNPLPEGTRVLLEIETTAGNLEPVTVYLDINGHFVYSFTLDREAVYEFYVTIEGSEEYAGLSRQILEESEGISASVTVVHPFTIFVGYLPWLGLVAAVAIGSVIGYRQFVVLPRRQDRRKRLQSISDAFSDVANLSRLLVVHKDSGVCIFEPFVDETMDATLMAGFLQAISTFGVDLGQSSDLVEKGQAASELRDITYQGFKILLHDGKFVRTALVLSGDPSPQLRDRLEVFTTKFEEQYRGYFDHWTGRIDYFNSASHLVEEIFIVSLRLPHRVAPRRSRGVSLSDLENRLYKIAKELTKDREYLFLGQIADTYMAAAKEDKLEVFMALFVLRQKSLLIPWEITPSISRELPFPDTPATDTAPDEVLLPAPPTPEPTPPEQQSEEETPENGGPQPSTESHSEDGETDSE
ncbi:MAG: hypothetical protein ACFFCO_05480 [Promethearchaeota archaeon]